MSVEFLRIKKDSNFYLQGSLVKTDDVKSLNDYLIQLLGFYTNLDENITLSELVHAFYGMKEFVSSYFSEDYEIIRAFATGSKLVQPCKYIRVYKTFRSEPDEFLDDDEYVYITTEVEIVKVEEAEKGYDKLGDLPIVLDDNITFEGDEFSFKKKTKFTLLDILCSVFEEVSDYVKRGENISA